MKNFEKYIDAIKKCWAQRINCDYCPMQCSYSANKNRGTRYIDGKECAERFTKWALEEAGK